jgi:bis(5'-nucleosyl)-tetraphosphatase (symmetrical)
MVHAGLVPEWDVDTAAALAREVETQLAENYGNRRFLTAMYGDEPVRWRGDLAGMARTRFIINAMTRMRYCDGAGRMGLGLSGPPGSQPPSFLPWFEQWRHTSHRVVFGHWSTLGAGNHGNAVSTDSGCVWGGALTAVRLDPGPVSFYSVDCAPHAGTTAVKTL